MLSKRGFPTLRHNEVWDLTADLLTEVLRGSHCCSLSLVNSNPSTIRQRDARLDIRARGFWERRQSTFFDVRVFHPNAPSYRCSPLPTTHRRHKKREYADRVLQIEQGSFTPLVLSSAGGMGDYFLQETCQPHLPQSKESIIPPSWLRCRLSFALLRSSLLCIRTRQSQQEALCSSLPWAEPCGPGRTCSL